jgi:hypothetical protein
VGIRWRGPSSKKRRVDLANDTVVVEPSSNSCHGAAEKARYTAAVVVTVLCCRRDREVVEGPWHKHKFEPDS